MKEENFATVYDWMREPDFAERCDLEWFVGWINRRPIKELTGLRPFVEPGMEAVR